jgi:hypothetical protein
MSALGAWWPWVAFALLGAYHGVNPGMGWLFAVARGLQERRRGAVLASLLPIAVGHELSVVTVVVAVALSQAFTPPTWPACSRPSASSASGDLRGDVRRGDGALVFRLPALGSGALHAMRRLRDRLVPPAASPTAPLPRVRRHRAGPGSADRAPRPPAGTSRAGGPAASADGGRPRGASAAGQPAAGAPAAARRMSPSTFGVG